MSDLPEAAEAPVEAKAGPSEDLSKVNEATNVDVKPASDEKRAETNGGGGGGAVPSEALSKRELKRRRKREEWLSTKSERRKEERLKKKAKMAKKREEKDFDCSYYAHRKRLKKEKTMAGSASRVHVVMDLDFEDKMNQKDLGKCCKQVLHCYG